MATVHPPEVRAEALRLRATGMPIRKVAAAMCLPWNTVQTWCHQQRDAEARLREAERPKPKRKGGSGVIAPKPYRCGYKWSMGRGEGWA